MAADHGMHSESAYRQVCEYAGIALIGTDRELNITIWNTAAARMFGAPAEVMVGTKATSIVPQSRRQLAEELMRQALVSRTGGELEFQHRNDQGERRELSGIISPVVADDGEPTGTVLCIRDITNRVVLIEQLGESRKMASLGEMAGAIAHHFNNILGGVITSVDYAVMSDNPLIKSRILEQISRSLHKATTLVDSLLAFAKGDQRTEAPGDFGSIIAELQKEFEPATSSQKITFLVHRPDLPPLRVPRLQVRTILRNITQNAVDAMPDGGTLEIRVELGPEEVITAIRDTGGGFDEAVRARIFEPFWSTKGVLAGGQNRAPGLGLAVAHGLVQMIGGTIECRSEVNKGSTFVLRLPRQMDFSRADTGDTEDAPQEGNEPGSDGSAGEGSASAEREVDAGGGGSPQAPGDATNTGPGRAGGHDPHAGPSREHPADPVG
jgi:two-component system cell cycle sensor histidine kinase/response regulator CckA